MNYKSFKFWILVLILLYTVIGFFLVPPLLKNAIVDTAQQRLGRMASVERIQSNPFVLSVRINGFELLDRDDQRLAAFDELFVNFQLSSLFRWAWTFEEIRLDSPDLLIERFSTQESRLSALMDDFARTAEPASGEDSEDDGLPRLLVHHLALNDGSAEFRDHVPEQPVTLEAGPVSVSIQELSTLPDRSGQQTVSVNFPGGAALTWNGSLNLAPLDSEGQLALSNADLEKLSVYLKGMAPIESFAAMLSISTRYSLRETGDGGLELELSALQGKLADLAVSGLASSGPQGATEFFRLDAVELSGGSMHYPEQTAHFESIQVMQPQLTAWLDPDGALSLNDLVPESGDPDQQDVSESGDWRVTLDEFLVNGGIAHFTDRSVEPNANISLRELSVGLTGLSNEDGTEMPLTVTAELDGGGRLAFDGQLVALPEFLLKGTARSEHIPLAIAEPYVVQQLTVEIEQGELHSNISLDAGPGDRLSVIGEASLAGLKVRDTANDQSLLAWEMLTIDRFEADTTKEEARVSVLEFEQPYGRFQVNPDRTTNLSVLMKAPAGGQPEALTEEAAPAWSLVIGGITVDEGSMDFSDLSLPLPFATFISGLDGTISTIASASTEPANIRLEGQVDDYGLARIEGKMNVFDPVMQTDVSVEFRNLLMSNLSPYTVEFAGREIDEGKLDLDLQYLIEDGQLAGQNTVVLSDLVLGAEVESPNAVSLPLGLAVALLKDSNGVIDIDLPVSGDINDPEFKIGGVIWKAFAGLIVKVVSAPFRLLGNLVGIDSEDFGQFQFLAGRSDLTPPELEKVTLLVEALQKRPELVMEINGAWDPVADEPVLKYFRLRDTVLERMGTNIEELDSDDMMLDEGIRKTLEDLFRERFPGTDLKEIRAQHTQPPAGDPEGKAELDELAYAGYLRDRLLESETIRPDDLAALAESRAQAVYDAFMENGVLDASRVQLGKSAEVESEDGEWVQMELGVAGG